MNVPSNIELRDWFAGMAMQALIRNTTSIRHEDSEEDGWSVSEAAYHFYGFGNVGGDMNNITPSEEIGKSIAMDAYQLADTMLNMREAKIDWNT